MAVERPGSTGRPRAGCREPEGRPCRRARRSGTSPRRVARPPAWRRRPDPTASGRQRAPGAAVRPAVSLAADTRVDLVAQAARRAGSAERCRGRARAGWTRTWPAPSRCAARSAGSARPTAAIGRQRLVTGDVDAAPARWPDLQRVDERRFDDGTPPADVDEQRPGASRRRAWRQKGRRCRQFRAARRRSRRCGQRPPAGRPGPKSSSTSGSTSPGRAERRWASTFMPERRGRGGPPAGRWRRGRRSPSVSPATSRPYVGCHRCSAPSASISGSRFHICSSRAMTNSLIETALTPAAVVSRMPASASPADASWLTPAPIPCTQRRLGARSPDVERQIHGDDDLDPRERVALLRGQRGARWRRSAVGSAPRCPRSSDDSDSEPRSPRSADRAQPALQVGIEQLARAGVPVGGIHDPDDDRCGRERARTQACDLRAGTGRRQAGGGADNGILPQRNTVPERSRGAVSTLH